MIDLTGNDNLITKWVYDEPTDSMTVQFRDEDDVLIDSIKIEGSRFQSLLESMQESVRHFDLEREKYRSIFDSSTLETSTEFYET